MSVQDDNFKPLFKYFKSKLPPPDLKLTLDTRLISQWNSSQIDYDNVSVVCANEAVCNEAKEFGLKNPKEWTVLKVKKRGLIILVNPFNNCGQLALASQCLQDYPRSPPNKTNLDLEKSSSESDFDWFSTVQKDPSLVSKLRWATLGYHHDWDSKVYNLEERSDVPEQLRRLVQFVAKCIGIDDFRPEAAIVNYYPFGSSLGGHTDHSEPDQDKPLFSISLGQSAVFLIGGPSKSVTPDAFLLRSGDIIIMTGPSRKSFHAVPRIVKDDAVDDILKDLDVKSAENRFISKYMKEHRINVNIRQLW